MYAVVRTGGKQLRVSPGDVVNVEKIAAEPGATLELSDVLLVSGEQGTTLGTPTVPNAKVICEVLGEGRGKKIVVFKYKRRKNYRRKMGHRQPFSKLAIKEIRVG
ncbi:MAG: 50S ribosomal protein L21 [Deltaproteobacteria bacterium]|nr:50S ribosomal protein L21 [Deltaproteobacteria bacterium]